MTAFGDLKIVASFDLGGLGPREGDPVVYHRSLRSCLPPLLPYLLMLGLLLLPANRNVRAWTILAPLGALFLAVSLSQTIPLLAGRGFGDLVLVFWQLAIGLAALWLLSDRLGRAKRFAVFLRALAIWIGVSAITGYCAQAAEIPLPFVLIAFGVCAALVLIALSLAGARCRKRYTPLRFALWTALWLLAASVVISTACIGYVLLVADEVPVPVGQAVRSFAAMTAVLSGGCFVILLPFLLLTFWNPLYRERFLAIYRFAETMNSSFADSL